MFKGLLKPTKPAGNYVTQAEIATLREQVTWHDEEVKNLGLQIAAMREEVAKLQRSYDDQPAKKPAAKRTRKKVTDDGTR